MSPDRRPSLGPPPPVGGAALAVRTAVRRRRARRWAAAGTASVTALAVAAVVTVTGSGTAALDIDRHDIATEPTAEPGSTPTPEATSSAGPVPVATASSTSSATPPAEGTAAEEPADEESGAPPTTAADPSYRTPEMRLTSSRRPGADAPGAGPVFCGGSVTGSEEDVDGQVGWCVDLALEDTREGHAVSLRICRDDSGEGELTFATSRETEMVVRRGDAVVWRWSTDHPARDEPHSLPAATGDCWTWSLAYTDVDQSGRELPAGSYEVTAATTAAELDAGGSKSAGFTIA